MKKLVLLIVLIGLIPTIFSFSLLHKHPLVKLPNQPTQPVKPNPTPIKPSPTPVPIKSNPTPTPITQPTEQIPKPATPTLNTSTNPTQPTLPTMPTQPSESKPKSYQWKTYSIGKVLVKSNDATYGVEEIKQDLNKFIASTDCKKLTYEKITELTAGILSAAERYYPELPTKDICRVLIGTMYVESKLNPTFYNGAYSFTGKGYGLMQIAPYAEIRQLDLFKTHHNFSNLFEYGTGDKISAKSLKAPDDLYNPWVNIHIGAWIQSNFGRTGGKNPSEWSNATPGPVASTVKSGLGSWIAGAASNGDDGYGGSRDFESNAYFKDVLNAASLLFEKKLEEEFLENMKLKYGVIYYKA